MSPSRWLVLTVRVPSAGLRDELAEGLVALGGSAVEESAGTLTTYLPEPASPEAFMAEAARRLTLRPWSPTVDDGNGDATAAPELHWRWQADEDWSARWKDGLAPRVVGRITVTQPWNPVEEEGGGIVIVIDPATAFGTGEHATTRGALRLMQRTIRGGERVLDVGAGSGILSIAAVRLGAGRVLAPESDEGSLGTAAENLARNGVAGSIRLLHQRVDTDWLEAVRGDGFDLIVANVLSGILLPLLAPFEAALRPNGSVILGGILAEEAGAVLAAADRAGLRCVETDREDEWWTGLFRASAPARGEGR